MVCYDEFCVDHNDNPVPSRHYLLNFSQFSEEPAEVISGLKEIIGIDDQIYSFIAYRKEVEL